MMQPLFSSPLLRFANQWWERGNGEFVVLNLTPYYLWYRIVEVFSHDIYHNAMTWLVFLRVMAAVGVYLVLTRLSAAPRILPSVVAIASYLLSPALFNGHVYWVIYSFIPWFFYFVLKVIQQRHLGWWDILGVNLVLFFSTMDLPTPKYAFFLLMTLLVSLAAARSAGLISWGDLWRQKTRWLIALAMMAWVVVPLVLFFLNFAQDGQEGLVIRQGYSSNEEAPLLEYNVNTASRAVRLYNGLGLGTEARQIYANSLWTNIANYVPFLFIVFYWMRKRRLDAHEKLLAWLLLLFFFFSIGPNPPLGAVYEKIVTSTVAMAFLRTSAGANFFLALFVAASFFLILSHEASTTKNSAAPPSAIRNPWRSKLATTVLGKGFLTFYHGLFNNRTLPPLLLGTAILVSGYPMVFGGYYANWSCCNPHAQNGSGIRIPESYFKLKGLMEAKRLDARFLVANSDLSYINTRWGFFGPSAFYTFLFDLPLIGHNSIPWGTARHNVGYLFRDDSLFGQEKPLPSNTVAAELLHKEEDLSFQSLVHAGFLPRVRVAQEVMYSREKIDYELAPQVVLLSPDAALPPTRLTTPPVVEYHREAAHKYRLIFHDVQGDFLFVLAENFHHQWRLSLSDPSLRPPTPAHLPEAWENAYRVFRHNDKEQADGNEVKTFLQRGWVSTLGTMEKRFVRHIEYSSQSRKVRSVEPYHIDFISKNFFGTIQNNNLPMGGWLEETLSPGDAVTHVKADGYANGWLVQPQRLMALHPQGMRQGKNGYDLELVAEFQPQRWFLKILIFTGSLVALVLLLGSGTEALRWFQRRRRET